MKRVGSSEASFNFIKCDASLLEDVRRCSAEFASQVPRLDYLVLSQGISTFQGRTPTREGIDEKLALHYYSRVSFVGCLRNLLQKTARLPGTDVRVLFVLSGGVHSPYAHTLADPALEHHYSLKNAADAAGYHTDLAVDALSRSETENIKYIHMAPGFVATAWGSGLPLPVKWLTRCIQLFARSKEDCGDYVVSGLTGPFTPARESAPSLSGAAFSILNADAQTTSVTTAHTAEVREALWAHTKQILALHDISL